MAKRELILQGFTPRTHIDVMRELFGVPDIRRVILSVAFVSESGVQQIESELREHAGRVTVFAGIRNDITSHQGLSRLHSIIGSNLFIVDTGSRNVTFHPKVYLVSGKMDARLVVGSANLTLGGLNNNIEASVMLSLDLTDSDDEDFVSNLEGQLAALPSDYPENVVSVSSLDELDDLLAGGRIVDESASSAPNPVASIGKPGASDTVPAIKLKTTPRRRDVSPVRAPTSRVSAPASAHGVTTVDAGFDLVWQSKPLKRRDLNIPDEKRTNPTGSMNLDKGLLPKEVDHRHYFREVVFAALEWNNKSKTIEKTSAMFRLVVKGIDHGEFELSIQHKLGTTSRTYQQRNAMTRLSWGLMRRHVALPDLINRTLSLYRSKPESARFILEID